MNIEAISTKGVKTIKKWSPTLAISVYHRVSDLWYIPLQQGLTMKIINYHLDIMTLELLNQYVMPITEKEKTKST